MDSSLKRFSLLVLCSLCVVQLRVRGMSTADKALYDALYAAADKQGGGARFGSQINLSSVENALKAGANANLTTKDHVDAPLLEAVFEQNVPLAELLLKYKANVNVKTSDNETPAHLAARPETLTLFDLLVKNGADLKAQNSEGLTAPEKLLMQSVASNNEKVARRAIELGANVNVAFTGGSWNRWTPLHDAAQTSKVMVQLLLSNKANPNSKNGDGDTPAHIAASPDKLDMFEALVQGGADLKIKNNEGKTASDLLLMESVGRGDEKAAARALKLGAHVNAVFQNYANSTPLHNAAHTGNLAVIDLLLKNGADITLINSEGQTPLHIAAALGNSAVLNRLLQATPDVSAVETSGNTPLHYAAEAGDLASFNALLTKGADPKIKNKDGYTAPDLLLKGNQGGNATGPAGTPININAQKRAVELGANVNAQFYDKQTVLHQAAGRGNVVLAEFLLQKGAKVNAQNASGQTPVHYAAGSGRIDMLNLLVKNGADMKIKDSEGLTAPDLLLQYGAQGMLVTTPGGTVTVAAGSSENVDVLKRAVELGADVNKQFNDKQTVLHQAAGRGNVVLAEFLLQKGAKVNAQDASGQTPAHYAAESGHIDMLNLFVKNSADMKIKNNEGLTAPDLLLQYGAQGMMVITPGGTVTAAAGSSGNVGVLKKALELGANINAQFADKQTVLHHTAASGNMALVEFLLQHKANVNMQDENGNTPAHEAAHNGHRMIIALLSKHGANLAIKNNEGKIVKEVLASRATQGGNATVPAKKKAKFEAKKLGIKKPLKVLSAAQKKRLDEKIEQLKKIRAK